MRYPALVLLLATIALPTAVMAASVLLPEDTKNKTETPKGTLGLSPQISPATPGTLPSATATGTKATTPTTSTQQSTTTKITPGGKLAPKAPSLEDKFMADRIIGGKLPKQEKYTAIELKIKAFHEQEAKAEEYDARFISETPTVKNDNPNWKSGLAVSVAASYLWGPKDIAFIEKRLGYTSDEVPQNCQLKLDVDLQTTKPRPSFSDTIFSGGQSLIKYDDSKLLSVTFQPHAVCNVPQKALPRHGGLITKSGDKYSIQLSGTAECSVPEQAQVPKYLDAQYGGDSTISCQFR